MKYGESVSGGYIMIELVKENYLAVEELPAWSLEWLGVIKGDIKW